MASTLITPETYIRAETDQQYCDVVEIAGSDGPFLTMNFSLIRMILHFTLLHYL